MQPRRGLNYPIERIESLIEEAYRERNILRSQAGGTAAGRDLKKEAWKRIQG